MQTNRRSGLLMSSALALSLWCVIVCAQTAIPDMSGKVMTVNGPIAPAAIGHTLMHEHIFIDFSLPLSEPERWQLAGRQLPTTATEVAFYHAPLRMDMLGDVMLGRRNHDNYLLQDEPLQAAEIGEFKRHGGATIVDVTSIGLKRNPEGLRRLSKATGINIVMGSSWYTKPWYPAGFDNRSIDSLTQEIVNDIVVGVDGTGIRSGIIGEVGTMGAPLTPNEIKVIRASGRASRLTGAAVTLHTTARLREQPRILDILEQEGTDLTRVVVGHLDALVGDLPFIKALLARGVYVEFDVLGRPPRITARRPADADVADAVSQLIREGYGDRILLSQDVCTKTGLQAYGGAGYTFVIESVLPYLREHGVTDAQIHQLMVENPKRVLTFVAPRKI